MCLMSLVAGCRREDIRVYTAPKDAPAPPPRMARGPAREARPSLSWKLPGGWRETGPGEMSLASFSIGDGSGPEAQVSITPLGHLAGHETMIVNMWRQQVGLSTNSETEVAQQLQPIEVGGEKGSLFEVTGKTDDGGSVRIVTAMVHRSDASWFFKLAGDAALVGAQKPIFIEFLKSVQIRQAAPAEDTADAESTIPHSSWEVPARWKEISPGRMQVARFAMPDRGAAKAEVSISVFPGDTGGTLANVNRWRRQIGLGEVSESGLAPLVSPLDPAVSEAILIDMTNNTRRLVGAIVPRGGNYWFYKLLGDADAVAPEKDAFVAFAKSKP